MIKGANQGLLLDAELLARLLHDGRNGRVVNVARGGEQMVLDLVAEAATDKIPKKGAAAEVGCGFDLKLCPIH
jgi:hypothetical protein